MFRDFRAPLDARISPRRWNAIRRRRAVIRAARRRARRSPDACSRRPARPAESRIVLHQEMAYLPRWPRKLAFYCLHAPDTGGETLISSVRRFERAADPRFLDEIRERGLLTTRNFRSPGPGAGVDDERPPSLAGSLLHRGPGQGRARHRGDGPRLSMEDDGSLTASFRQTGFMDHHVTGQRHWFNQLLSQTFTARSRSASAGSAMRRIMRMDGRSPMGFASAMAGRSRSRTSTR